MQFIDSQYARLYFGHLNYEHHLSMGVDSSLGVEIQDVRIKLHGAPGQPPVVTGLHDLHLYLRDADITQDVREELKELIAAEDESLFLASYSSALTRWLALAGSMGLAYGADVQTEQEVAEQLRQTIPAESLLNQLGDRNVGWAGHLHVFNFLYSEIPLPALSLKKVLARHGARTGQVFDLATMGPTSFIVSEGPCRLFSQQWDPATPARGGSVALSLDIVYGTDVLDDIGADLESIATYVGQGGIIQQILLKSVQQGFEDLRSEVEEAHLEIKAHVTHLETAHTDVKELQRAIERL